MLKHNCKGNAFQFLFAINCACVTALAEACQALLAAVAVGQKLHVSQPGQLKDNQAPLLESSWTQSPSTAWHSLGR